MTRVTKTINNGQAERMFINKQKLTRGGRVMTYKVSNVIDGDTFEVLPPWKWRDQSGIRVRPTGYSTPEEGIVGYQRAKDKLTTLILEKEVELKNQVDIDYDRLACDVYFDGKNLADYFPEYKE